MAELPTMTAGFVVGLMVGLTGIGGGALMTPILVLVFGTVPKAAVGTDLFFAAITKLAGVAMHARQGTIDWQVCRRLAAGSLPAALLTGLLLHMRAPADPRMNAIIMSALAGMLIVTAIGVFLKDRLHAVGKNLRLKKTERFKTLQAPLTVLAGVVLGVVVTLTSVGAGALGTVIMLYLYPLRLTSTKVVGTDLAHAIPLALVAGLTHLWAGNVNYTLLATLLAGSIPGVIIGAWCSTKMAEKMLSKLLALLLLVAGVKILTC